MAIVVGGLADRGRCYSIIFKWRKDLAFVLSQEVAKYFAKHLDCLPDAGMAEKWSEQGSGHIWWWSIFFPQIPKVS